MERQLHLHWQDDFSACLHCQWCKVQEATLSMAAAAQLASQKSPFSTSVAFPCHARKPEEIPEFFVENWGGGGWGGRGPRKPEALYITWLLSFEPKPNSQRGPVFDARPVHMWSVVQNVAQGPVITSQYHSTYTGYPFLLICPRRYVMLATDSVFNLCHFLFRTRIALIVCYLTRANFHPRPHPLPNAPNCVFQHLLTRLAQLDRGDLTKNYFLIALQTPRNSPLQTTYF